MSCMSMCNSLPSGITPEALDFEMLRGLLVNSINAKVIDGVVLNSGLITFVIINRNISESPHSFIHTASLPKTYPWCSTAIRPLSNTTLGMTFALMLVIVGCKGISRWSVYKLLPMAD